MAVEASPKKFTADDAEYAEKEKEIYLLGVLCDLCGEFKGITERVYGGDAHA
jgi:hypothetical protein